MRLRIYIAIFCIQLCGCADDIAFYNKNGTLLAHAHLMSDRLNEKLVAPGGYSYSDDSASISTVTRANWHGAVAETGALGGIALLFVPGAPVASKLVAGAVPSSLATYRGTAPTPTPAPVVLQGKH